MRNDRDSGTRQLVDLLEARLAEVRATLDRLAEERAKAIDTFTQQRDFVREAIEQAITKFRAEEIVRLWESLTAAHEQIVRIREEQRAETVAAERPATEKLH